MTNLTTETARDSRFSVYAQAVGVLVLLVASVLFTGFVVLTVAVYADEIRNFIDAHIFAIAVIFIIPGLLVIAWFNILDALRELAAHTEDEVATPAGIDVTI